MKPAIGYVRVSTERQAVHGASLDAQRARIEAWCKVGDAELVSVHVDAGLSGGRADNRPALQEALSEVCRVKGVLVVYSLSRLARSVRDTLAITERLDKAGADLVSLSESLDTSSAAGKMVFRLLAVLAEFERDLASERTTHTMAYLRAKGRRISGKIPFGWRLAPGGKMLERVEGEQSAIRGMRAMRGDGIGLRAIARAMNEGDGSWTATSVRRVLSRPTKEVS